MTTARKRTTIAATVGVLLIALVQWAATEPDLAQLLATLLPAPWGRLVLVLLGGAATVAAVYRASLHPAQSPPADTLEQPAPADMAPPGYVGNESLVPVPAPAALSPQGVTLTPTAGVGAPILAPPPLIGNHGTPEPEPATALVQLVPAPRRSYL